MCWDPQRNSFSICMCKQGLYLDNQCKEAVDVYNQDFFSETAILGPSRYHMPPLVFLLQVITYQYPPK